MYCTPFSIHDRLLRLQGQPTQSMAVVFLVLVVCLAVISDDLKSSNHLTNSEETQYLSEDDPGRSQLSRVHVADAAEERFGAGGV